MVFALLTNLQLFGTIALAAIFIRAVADRKITEKQDEGNSLRPIFFKKVGILLLLFLIFVMAFNYVINPMGIYASRILPPIVATSRLDKVRLWSLYSPP